MDQEQMVESGKKKDGILNSCRENPWIVSTVVLAIISILLIIPFSSLTGNVISEDDVGQKLLDLYSSQGVTGLTLDSVKEVSGVYEVNFKYQGAVVPVYITKDASLVGSLSAFPASTDSSASKDTASTEVPKADKTKAELFVMTYCPYGTQAEKGFLPVLEAFGKNFDGKIRFVHYFMHGDKEEQETYTQVCIREEQPTKYFAYLREFLAEGNSANALKKALIDTYQLDECVQNRAKNYYKADSDLSNKYGVQGSPTLVVNGVIADSGRSASAMLQTVCSGFKSAPAECTSLKLDSTNPAAMWGWSASTASSASAAQCS